MGCLHVALFRGIRCRFYRFGGGRRRDEAAQQDRADELAAKGRGARRRVRVQREDASFSEEADAGSILRNTARTRALNSRKLKGFVT